jgi:hypothetical protein
MKGEISVVSEEGKGSDFFFELPLTVAADDENREEDIGWIEIVKNRPIVFYSAHPTTQQVLNQCAMGWGMKVSVLKERSIDELDHVLEETAVFMLDIMRLKPEEAAPLMRVAAGKGAAIITYLPITRAKLDQSQICSPAGSRHIGLSKPIKRRELLRSMAELFRMPAESSPPLSVLRSQGHPAIASAGGHPAMPGLHGSACAASHAAWHAADDSMMPQQPMQPAAQAHMLSVMPSAQPAPAFDPQIMEEASTPR